MLALKTRGDLELYAWDAPGMPSPGPDFLNQALLLGDSDTVVTKKKGKKPAEFRAGGELSSLYERALREPGFELAVEIKPGITKPAIFVPGHIWGQHAEAWQRSQWDPGYHTSPPVNGPHRADVMIIGKMPWKDEIAAGRNLVGASGKVLHELLLKLHVSGFDRWYVTNLVKFMPPNQSRELRASWIQDCAPLLQQELRLVRPRFILCLGADASKALLGKSCNVSNMEGRVVEYSFQIQRDSEEQPRFHNCQVMTVVHPVMVAESPDMGRILERGLARFKLLIEGQRFDAAETDIDHRVITTYEDAVDLIDEVNYHFHDVPAAERLVAWDAEWHGRHAVNKNAYMRLLQMSWAPKHAACFKLRAQGGKICFVDRQGKPAIKRLMKLLHDFMYGKRAVGHFFYADLEFMRAVGFDPTHDCPVPLEPRDGLLPWQRLMAGEGWLDTAIMAHAIEETAEIGLEMLVSRYTTAPRYDLPMEEWRDKYCKERGIPKRALEGYGEAPDELLLPYSMYDADATLRLCLELQKYLSCDYDNNNCWEPCWEAMSILPVIREMREEGILIDQDRLKDLADAFHERRDGLEGEIRDAVGWDQFNVRSVQHVRQFLYGFKLNGRVVKEGESKRIGPKSFISLELEPLVDTSKTPIPWARIRKEGTEDEHSPSTNKSVLAILAQDYPEHFESVNLLRDYRFIDQAYKTLCRQGSITKDGATFADFWEEDEEGEELLRGLPAYIDDDGRIRTFLRPTAETGRWKSSLPPLQNWSKQRDPDYERLLGERYKHKMRSMMVAPPGRLMVEFDYTGAELFLAAVMSGDKNMIEHAQRNTLPKNHPDFYDIHSNVAVRAFKLKCVPTEDGLKAIGKKELRIVAKSIIFGLMYGRGAKAIAFAIKERGVTITEEEAQLVINTVFGMYPGLRGFFDECRERAIEVRWLCNCFGRFRRFPEVLELKRQGEFEREAMNFPIQSGIGSAVDRALANLWLAREQLGDPELFRFALQLHDAALLHVPPVNVDYVVNELIPYAACQGVPIYPTDLAGVPTGDGPYYLGVDTTVFEVWGESLSVARCRELGISEKFGVEKK